MLIYIVNYLCVPVYNILIKDKKKFVWILTFQMFLILALRNTLLGPDLIVYQIGYDVIAMTSLGDLISGMHIFKLTTYAYQASFESGYALLNWLISHIGFSFHGFLILHAAFCCISVGKFINKYSSKPWMSFALFIALGMYTYTFGILRQSLVTCIFLNAIPLIKEKKLVKFITVVVVAFFIQRIAIVLIIAYFVAGIKVNRKGFIVIYVSTFLILIFGNTLYLKTVGVIAKLFAKEKVIYASFEFNNLMLLLLIISIFIEFERRKNRSSEKFDLFYYIFLLTLPVEAFGCFNETFARLVHLFLVIIMIILPETVINIKNRKGRLAVEMLIYFLLFGYYIYAVSGTDIVPYISAFRKM